MSNMKFLVKAIWDDEAQVFYAESDIIGLHVEAATIAEFEAIMMEVGPTLVMENHITKRDLSEKSMLDLIPSIFLRLPAMGGPVAA